MSIDLAECLRCQSLSGSCQNALNSRAKVQHGNDDDDDDGDDGDGDGDDDDNDDNEEFWQSLWNRRLNLGGGGFAGLAVCRRLRSKRLNVTLLDAKQYLVLTASDATRFTDG